MHSVNVSHFPLVDGARLRDILDANDDDDRQRHDAGTAGGGRAADESRFFPSSSSSSSILLPSRTPRGGQYTAGAGFIPNLPRRRSSLRGNNGGALSNGLHRRLSSLVLAASSAIPGFLDSTLTASNTMAAASSSSSRVGGATQASSHPRPNGTASFPSTPHANASANVNANVNQTSTQVRFSKD